MEERPPTEKQPLARSGASKERDVVTKAADVVHEDAPPFAKGKYDADGKLEDGFSLVPIADNANFTPITSDVIERDADGKPKTVRLIYERNKDRREFRVDIPAYGAPNEEISIQLRSHGWNKRKIGRIAAGVVATVAGMAVAAWGVNAVRSRQEGPQRLTITANCTIDGYRMRADGRSASRVICEGPQTYESGTVGPCEQKPVEDGAVIDLCIITGNGIRMKTSWPVRVRKSAEGGRRLMQTNPKTNIPSAGLTFVVGAKQ